MNSDLHSCKLCGKTPAIVPLDVADTVSIVHAYCKQCKIATGWRFNRAAAVADWNDKYGTESQPTHAMSVLQRKKGEMAYA